MSQLGNQTTGFTFTISGSFGDVAGGIYTVPSPGIIVSQISVFADNNGTAGNARLYVWQNSGGKPGTWLIRGSSTFSLPGSFGWQRQSSLSVQGGTVAGSDLYLPAGTQIWVGIYAAAGVLAIQGSGSGTASELGNTADGNWNDHGSASGPGQLAAYIDYTALPPPTITSISPSVSPPGSSVTITGTSFLHASSVTIGGVAASFSITDDSHITATVPSSVGGVVTVTVTNPAGSGSSTMTAGQIYYGTGAAVNSIAAVWYGTGSGVAKVAGVWVPNGAGVKRVW